MVGFETGPVAEGRPNDPLSFNFLQLWVTASGKGEGNLHRKSASKSSTGRAYGFSTITSTCEVVYRLGVCMLWI